MAEEAAAPPPTAVLENYPTHRLRSIKAGANGVQFLVSSKEHLYDVEDMEGGDGVWQAVGVWEDATIQEGIRTLRQRQGDKELPQQLNVGADKAGVYGSGRKLGELPSVAQQKGATK